MMKQTLKQKLGMGLLVGSLIGAGGCTEMIKDSPIGWYHKAKEEIKAESRNNPWKGTAVVNRIVNPDGSIIFILDSRKIGRSININYADKFLDETKYDKKWEWYEKKFGFIITYIPKEE